MKRPIVLLALASLGLAASHPGLAADLAGIALDQPITLDECAARQHDYLPNDSNNCFKLPAGPLRDPYAAAVKPPVNGRIIVHVAPPDRPGFMIGSDAVVEFKACRAASISVRTHGTNGEGGDFRALKDAFGDASPRQLIVPWNTGGSGPVQTQTSLRADWILPGDETVYFNSGEFGAYFGLVRLQNSVAPLHQNGVQD
jgi:hypothetical protein